jgi:hypothetical protein
VRPELTLARQARLGVIADSASRQAAILWRKGMGADFDSSWGRVGPSLVALASQAQLAAGAGASAYVAATARTDGIDDAGFSAVQPGAWAGVDASGRTLDGLLYGAVTTSKTQVGNGAGLTGALQSGQVYLQTMVRTVAYDTGRSSNLTAATSHRYTHYVRAISAGACSRCAMLAGIATSRTPFQRHPGCRCTSEPVTGEDRVPARFTSPAAYFESLAPGEQDRIFTRAGAEAIRAGADPVRVVSARRSATQAYTAMDAGVRRLSRLDRSVIGHRTDGTPILGYTTSEGTTRRGAYGRQTAGLGSGRRVRLMPETIIGLTPDVDLRRVLLRDAGYLDVPVTAAERSAALGGGFAARRAEILREDRAIADAFYRQHGIALGGSA